MGLGGPPRPCCLDKNLVEGRIELPMAGVWAAKGCLANLTTMVSQVPPIPQQELICIGQHGLR